MPRGRPGRPRDAVRHQGQGAAPGTPRPHGGRPERQGPRAQHRAALGATDMRARAAGHRTELAELGLRLALDEGRPRQAFAWAERGRATDLSFPRPPRPPEEPEVAQALAELRGIVVRVNELRGAGSDSAEAARLLHGVRPLLPPHATVERVLAGIEGAALVHLAAHGRLVAHNPLFSDLLLSDGPLVACDVERVQRPPHTVV